jgi:hypothetical protein
MTVPLAYFGITSSGVNLAINLVILFLVIIWFSLLYWTYADARRRIEDNLLVGCSVAASAFPFVGTLVYMILRPPEYLEDMRERELEMQAAEARVHSIDVQLCPHCDYHIERDFLRCPHCLRKVKEPCVNCARPLDPAWPLCPYCETEVPGANLPRRSRRRRETPPEGAPEPRRRRESAAEPAIAEPRRRPPSDAASAERRRRAPAPAPAPETAYGEARRLESAPDRGDGEARRHESAPERGNGEPRRRETPPERVPDAGVGADGARVPPPARVHQPAPESSS